MPTMELNQLRLPLADAVQQLVTNQLAQRGKGKVVNLYALVLEQMEPALFKATLELSRYNQSKAARYLGLHRATFRARLQHYFADSYCPKKKE
jgi:Fis family transcriptional regulator, factor for inversion stimulation protein